ncbi:hypothetical protein CICLE_v10024044mg [Citrus x clementina]|uniref:AAA+ ATPase domain-containing protein n=2 Tax=Citrus TaxID=2706 RepID=V4TEJ0_CITCL|nr:hypothetical protein CICLE_v10024044mg [Citrus x clementina]
MTVYMYQNYAIMPSPSPIPRSSSYLNISNTSAKNHRRFLSSSRTRSSSGKFSYWPHWSNINQLGNLIIPGRNSSDSSSKHSDLTEESLEAHNRRHAPIVHHHGRILNTNNDTTSNKLQQVQIDEKNYAKCSPYYKGLTDASLVINRDRVIVESSSSPGRESQATTMAHSTATYSTSLSSLMVKMQEWSSCFTFKYYSSINNNNSNSNNSPAATATTTTTTSTSATTTTSNYISNTISTATPTAIGGKSKQAYHTAASSSTGTTTTSVNENCKEVAFNNAAAILLHNTNHMEKPLRERVSESEPEPESDSILQPNESEIFFVEYNSDKDEDHHHHLGKNKDTNNSKGPEIILENQRDPFIWANMYQPKTLKDFICNRDRAIQLQGLVKEGGHGNFIFEGPPGVGKRTMIRAMLREAFGHDTVQGEARGRIQVNIKESSQHIEVNLSDLKGYERHVIVELMKETQSKISTKALQSNVPTDNTRAIILCEADKLSTDALLYMRWLLERYKGLNKVFFCCSDVSKLQPIKSLCTVIQLLPPSKQEIVEVLEFIAEQEGIQLPHQLAEKIADNSKNNLRQAIRSFEASRQMNYPFVEGQVILTGWEDDITNIATKIIEEQSPKQLYIIRGKLQNLIEHDVCLHFIFKSLVEELKKHLDAGLHRQLEGLYDEYNIDSGGRFDNEKPFVLGRTRNEEMGKRLNDPTRNKNIQHFLRIEEFIAKFMSWYKTTVKNCTFEPLDPVPIKLPF